MYLGGCAPPKGISGVRWSGRLRKRADHVVRTSIAQVIVADDDTKDVM